MKKCFKCGQVKPLSMFSSDKSRRDGLQPRCKSCYSEYKKSRRKPPRVLLTAEEIAERRRMYRDANREKLTANAARWRERNPEKVAASIQKYRVANADRLPEIREAYRQANRNKLLADARAYRAANPGWSAFHVQHRNARKRQATPVWANADEIASFYERAAAMTRDTGVAHHVDHIVPLQSNIVCGLHVEHNMQVLTASENTSKGNRYWPDMP